MANLVTSTFQHDDSKSLEISFKNKGAIKEFSIVGRLNTLHSVNLNANNIDIIDLMSSLPGSANKFFGLIKSHMDYKTNEAHLPKPENTREQKSRSYAANELKQHHAIKKSGQRSFIVNPYLIVPPIDRQEDIVKKWKSLP